MKCQHALLFLVCGLLFPGSPGAGEFHVSLSGSDANDGSAARPFATLARAQTASREAKSAGEVVVTVHAGTYYLPAPLVFTAEDSGTPDRPVIYRAAVGEDVVLSGGTRLHLQWSVEGGVQRARVPSGMAIDQVFVNNQRQRMARYPNYDPSILPYGGYAADALSPERVNRWASPSGGFIHAMHSAEWGGYHYRITGKSAANELTYEGGWQNNRQMGMHPKYRFVENIREELDAPGEWFHDRAAGILHFLPPEQLDLDRAVVEVPLLAHLVEFRGTPENPVAHLELRGFIFRHALRTFMEVREPLLRSDWKIYRGGAVLFKGASSCVLEDCEFDQVGGNAVFMDGWNRDVRIRTCDIHDTGASAVAFVGDPKSVRNPLFEYHQHQSFDEIDLTPGPKTPDYPADCVVEDCLLRNFGVIEKQAAGVQISMARGIAIRHCSIYEGPRAGINISEGTFGGHIIEFCDVFDTVRETGDHGSFNSWGRDRFWGLKRAPAERLAELALLDVTEPNVLRNNRWRCDHGWDVDLDDGSSNYLIYNNLFLRGGLKLREGFHRRVFNNIAVNNSLHPHVWFENSGDVVTNNIWMGSYQPAAMDPALQKWGHTVDYNVFTTSEADRRRFEPKGCDANSLVGDAMFLDPAAGDFRVKDESPARKLGFISFDMDQFGVQTLKLKQRARQAQIPVLVGSLGRTPEGSTQHLWLGAVVRDLVGDQYSAFGVARADGGVVVENVPVGSSAANIGLQRLDLVQAVNGNAVAGVNHLKPYRGEGEVQSILVIRNQQPVELKP